MEVLAHEFNNPLDTNNPFVSPFSSLPKPVDLSQNSKDLQADLDWYDSIRAQHAVIKSHEQGWTAAAGNFLGEALEPISFAVATLTEGLAKPFILVGSSLLERALPQIAEKIPERLTGLLPATVKGGAFMGGNSILSVVADNHNRDTNSFSYGNAAKDLGIGIGWGFTIGAPAWLVGKVVGKLIDAKIQSAKESQLSEVLINKGEKEGVLSSEFAEFARNYVRKAPAEELQKQAEDLVNKTSPGALSEEGRLNVGLATLDQLKMINSNSVNEVGNEFSENLKTALSDNIINSQLGKILHDSNIKEGIQGLISDLTRQLGTADKSLSNLLKSVRESVKDLPDKTAEVSQRTILAKALKGEYQGILPKTVKRIVQIKQRLKALKAEKIQSLELSKRKELPLDIRKNHKSNVAFIDSKVNELKGELLKRKPLSYIEELNELRNILFKKGELIKNYESTLPFIRLGEMINSRIKSLGARLLDAEVRFTSDLDKNKGFLELANRLKDAIDNPNADYDLSSNSFRYAEEVTAQKELETEATSGKHASNLEKEVNNKNQKILEPSEIDEEKDNEDIKKMKNVYNETLKSTDEMEKNKAVFDKFVDCVKGSL